MKTAPVMGSEHSAQAHAIVACWSLPLHRGDWEAKTSCVLGVAATSKSSRGALSPFPVGAVSAPLARAQSTDPCCCSL